MTETSKLALGIDVGGTGIKGALVDLTTGTLASERFRLDTPQPALPADVAAVIAAVADHFNFAGPTGVAFPGVVLDGVVHTAANLHPDWIGIDLADLVGSGAVRDAGPVRLCSRGLGWGCPAAAGLVKGTDRGLSHEHRRNVDRLSARRSRARNGSGPRRIHRREFLVRFDRSAGANPERGSARSARHGGSSPYTDTYRFSDDVADLVEIVADLADEVGEAELVGISAGAHVSHSTGNSPTGPQA